MWRHPTASDSFCFIGDSSCDLYAICKQHQVCYNAAEERHSFYLSCSGLFFCFFIQTPDISGVTCHSWISVRPVLRFYSAVPIQPAGSAGFPQQHATQKSDHVRPQTSHFSSRQIQTVSLFTFQNPGSVLFTQLCLQELLLCTNEIYV